MNYFCENKNKKLSVFYLTTITHLNDRNVITVIMYSLLYHNSDI